MKHSGILLGIVSVALAQPAGGPPKLTPAEQIEQDAAHVLNYALPRNYFMSLAAFAFLFIVYRVVTFAIQQLRTVACLSNRTQNYFAIPSPKWGKFNSAILYAPLFRTRHNREFSISSVVNMGTLPTRFQSGFIFALVATNVILCVYGIPYTSSRKQILSILRNRSGTISVVNMIPMVLMAGRNNPLISLLDVSFDTFNMMHRWLGRLVILEALTHTLCWMIAKVESAGWSAVATSLSSSRLIMTGMIGTAAFVVILLQSPSPVRHAFYETFLHLHIALVILSLVGLWIHLTGFSQRIFLVGTLIAWGFDRTLRLWSLIYRNVGNGGTKATLETLPGDAVRVTLSIARPWRVRPGQHVYLTIPQIGLWTSHPFSVAWSDTSVPFSRSMELNEKGNTLVTSYQDLQSTKATTVSAIVRRRTGFTDSLFKKAEQAQGSAGVEGGANGPKLTVSAFVEGPYGATKSLSSYGTVMLFAAGVGITHQVPYVRDLVAGHAEGTVAARRITLVWVVQSPEHLEWIRPWMTQILSLEKRREVLNVKLFITRPRNKKEVVSPSSTVQMFPGRPSVETLIGKECEEQIGTMGVSVCGTGELSDDVRKAVRSRQSWSNIDFVEESFSW